MSVDIELRILFTNMTKCLECLKYLFLLHLKTIILSASMVVLKILNTFCLGYLFI